MKKLMIAAAAAAMVGSVFATDAQVYDASLTVKTTACKDAKFTKALQDLGWFTVANGFTKNYAKGDKVKFRKTASKKINGLFWGCDCDTIATPAWKVDHYQIVGSGWTASVSGYAFWLAEGRTYTPFALPYTFFNWTLLNRIDQMKAVEGTWTLGNALDGQSFYTLGAGFGSATIGYGCDDVITAMRGNFAGWVQALNVIDSQTITDGCIFCGGSSETTQWGCITTPFCSCDPVDTRAISAAYGTWTLKYNDKKSARLNKAVYITASESFTGKFANVGNAIDAMRYAVGAVYARDVKIGDWVLPAAKQIKDVAPFYWSYLGVDPADATNILDTQKLPAMAEKQLKQIADAS